MKLVTVASFPTPAEAHMAANMLAAEGIRALAQDENMASTMWHLGAALGGVKLQVGQQDASRAAELLAAADGDAFAAAAQPTRAGHWTCLKCGERVGGDFAVCWACGTAMDGTEDPTFAGHRDDAHDETLGDEADEGEPIAAAGVIDFAPPQALPAGLASVAPDNPYASPRHASPPLVEPLPVRGPEHEHQQRLVEAGWRASIVGLLFVLLPVFSFYSGWLLLRAAMIDAEMSPASSRKFYIAMTLDLLLVGAWSIVALSIVR